MARPTGRVNLLSADMPGSRSKDVLKDMCMRRYVREREEHLKAARKRAVELEDSLRNQTVSGERAKSGDEGEGTSSMLQAESSKVEEEAGASGEGCTEVVTIESCNALANVPAIGARRRSFEVNSSAFGFSDKLNLETLKYLLSTGRVHMKEHLPALFEQASAIATANLLGSGVPVCRDIILYSPWLEGMPGSSTSELDASKDLDRACEDDRIQVLDSHVHYPTENVGEQAVERRRSPSPYSVEAAMEID